MTTCKNESFQLQMIILPRPERSRSIHQCAADTQHPEPIFLPRGLDFYAVFHDLTTVEPPDVSAPPSTKSSTRPAKYVFAS